MTPYANAADFRRSVTARAKEESQRRGRPINELLRQLVYQRFLARVFADPEGPWILKGGVGLLARMPDARHSRDIDLFHADARDHLDATIADLRAAVDRDLQDHLTFVLGRVRESDGDIAAQIAFAAYAGATVLEQFTVDLATHLRPVARVDRIRPEPAVPVPGLSELPELRVYPLPDQMADKVCAMYSVFGATGAPSSRYRDLVDLVLVLIRHTVRYDELADAIGAEAHRRGLSLPTEVSSPGPGWTAGFATEARRGRLPQQLTELPAALQLLGSCLDPILAGTTSAVTWDPETHRWAPDPN